MQQSIAGVNETKKG